MSNENDVRLVGNYTIELNQQGPPGAPGLGIASINEIGYDIETGEYSYRITYTDGTYYDFTIQGGARYTGSTGIIINNDIISVDTDVIATKNDLLSKQNVIDSSNKLSSDLVDDTGNTNKFATQSQLNQIGTNQTDISTINSKIPSEATSVNKLADKNYVDTTDTDLQNQINNLKARGRFLALWNCATGLAETNPPQSPYVYQTGDYFIIGTVSSANPQVNYKPNGSSYTTGVASSTLETNTVDVDDVYYYDGTSWHLQINTQKTVSFVNIAGNPYDNTNLATALNDKQDTISDLSDIRTGAGKGDTAVQPSDLATVATTGDYDDLLNKPTIPSAQIQSDWTQSDNTAVDYIKNKPTIPTVNDGTITLTQGGVTKGSFTVNQSGDSTIDLDAGGGGGQITVDDHLDSNSTNPVQNKIVTGALNEKQDELTAGDGIIIDNETFTVPEQKLGNYSWNRIKKVNNMLIAMSGNSSTNLGYSTNGTNWTTNRQTGLRNRSWLGISYNGSKYVALDSSGYVSTSTNGTSWGSATQIANLGNKGWRGLAYNGSKFVAITLGGFLSTSTDGTTWTTASYVSNLGNNTWCDLIYNGTKFIALSSTGYLSTSTNGTTWTTATQNTNLGNKTWKALEYNGSMYVALSSYGDVSTSSDGDNWTSAVRNNNLSAVTDWGGIAYINNKFFTLGNTGNMSSWDGGDGVLTIKVNSDSSLSSTSKNPVQNKVIYNALSSKQDTLSFQYPLQKNNNTISLFIDNELSEASSNPVQNSIITTELNNKQNKLIAGNGITLGGPVDFNNISDPDIIKPDEPNTTQWHDIINAYGKYIAVGEFGTFAISEDLENWSICNSQTTMTSSVLNSIKIFAPQLQNTYIAVGDNSTVVTTTDLQTFTATTVGTDINWQKVINMSSGVAMIGTSFNQGTGMLDSYLATWDGIGSWAITQLQLKDVSDIIRLSNNRLVVIGGDGKIGVSTDNGTTWSFSDIDQSNPMHPCIIIKGPWLEQAREYVYVIISDNGYVYNSTDLTNWYGQQIYDLQNFIIIDGLYTNDDGGKYIILAEDTNGTYLPYLLISNDLYNQIDQYLINNNAHAYCVDYTYNKKILVGCEWDSIYVYHNNRIISCTNNDKIVSMFEVSTPIKQVASDQNPPSQDTISVSSYWFDSAIQSVTEYNQSLDKGDVLRLPRFGLDICDRGYDPNNFWLVVDNKDGTQGTINVSGFDITQGNEFFNYQPDNLGGGTIYASNTPDQWTIAQLVGHHDQITHDYIIDSIKILKGIGNG